MNTRFYWSMTFSGLLLATGWSLASAQEPGEPVVARLEMKLTLDQKVIDVIDPGDLLTVLSERETSYIIQTFNGQKGAVAKVNALKLAEAVPIYDELIEQRPDEGRLYTLRASAHWARSDTEKALADYDRAIALGYDEAHAFSSRGLFHSATGNYAQAIEDYSVAIEKDAQDEVPLLNRASVYMSTGEYEEAVEDYTSAVALRPDNPIVYSQRAVAYKLLGKTELAISDYDKTIELDKQDVSAWMGRGFLKYQLERHQEAIDDFSQVIELAPQTAVAFNNRGYNYQALHQYEQALDDFRRAVELAPRYLLALQNQAWLLTLCEDESLRDSAEAIKVATVVCELSEFADLSDLTLLAAAYASAGEFGAAVGWQEKAVELASDEQRELAQRILQRYQNEMPLEAKLLEADPENEVGSQPLATERPPNPK